MKILAITCLTLFCYSWSSEASELDPTGFATRTSYLLNGNPDTSYPLPAECKPVYFWGFVRHGARIPDEDDVDEWAERLPNIRDKILESWLNGHSLDDETLEYIDAW